MKVIQKKDKVANIVARKQKKVGDSVRFLTYCIATKCDDGVLLHNTMTKELLLLEGTEGNSINLESLNDSTILQDRDSELFAYLAQNWFIVPTDTNDKQHCLALRALAQQLNKKAHQGITSYTILTTDDCNARCFYCYEKGTLRRNMTHTTAIKTADFIRTHCEGKKVSLHWFGGEPLYNMEVIDVICEELRKNDVKYHSSMVSNGYLFDDNVVKRAVEQWKLRKIQITLDGTEEVYNRRKAYIYKVGSPFVRVTDNIERLLKAGITVDIRLNLDEKNFDDLMVLADFLVTRYGQYDKFNAYARYLFSKENCAPLRGETSVLSHYMLQLQKRLHINGRKSERNLARRIKTNCCMADGDSSLLVQADGSLGRCEHYYNSRSCGNIETGITDMAEVERWKELSPDVDVCDTCPIYPDCIRLSLCDSTYHHACQTVPAYRQNKVKDVEHAMSARYEAFLSADETEEDEAV